MVTLRHAFDANSMKGLVLKILRGNYPAIPSTYSDDLKGIIADMLIKEPQKRPSMRKILEKPFLSNRISKLLTMTIARNEFSNTFVTNHLNPVSSQAQMEEEKKGEGDTATNQAQADNGMQEGQHNVAVVKQKITLSKDASKKKKRIEVMQVNHSAQHNQSHAAATGGEEDENGYVSNYFASFLFNLTNFVRIRTFPKDSQKAYAKRYHKLMRQVIKPEANTSPATAAMASMVPLKAHSLSKRSGYNKTAL